MLFDGAETATPALGGALAESDEQWSGSEGADQCPESVVHQVEDEPTRAGLRQPARAPVDADILAEIGVEPPTTVEKLQYAPATVRAALPAGAVTLRVETGYPVDGRVRVTVVEAPGTPWTLSLRVPGWAQGATLTDAGGERPVAPGYAVTRDLAAGDVVDLDLAVRARWTWPDPRVDAVRGQVAVERGPVVLCLESTDLGEDVNGVQVRTDLPPVEEDGAVLVPAATLALDETPWPYGADAGAAVRAVQDRGLVRLVPYASWANRGPSTMRVWMPAGR